MPRSARSRLGRRGPMPSGSAFCFREAPGPPPTAVQTCGRVAFGCVPPCSNRTKGGSQRTTSVLGSSGPVCPDRLGPRSGGRLARPGMGRLGSRLRRDMRERGPFLDLWSAARLVSGTDGRSCRCRSRVRISRGVLHRPRNVCRSSRTPATAVHVLSRRSCRRGRAGFGLERDDAKRRIVGGRLRGSVGAFLAVSHGERTHTSSEELDVGPLDAEHAQRASVVDGSGCCA